MNTGDFRVINGGSVIGIKPISTSGEEWWQENVQEAEGWQVTNGFVWCDHRQADAIISGFVEAGLVARIV